LFNDDWPSTKDLWTTEVIPTLIFSWITGQWWISVFYYIWAAFIQETVEHNANINLPILTSGQWHLMHHRFKCNYGLFTPIWDIVFKTYKKVDQ
jgi:sterol desaturase/sphingolipid hydroxylase (fatty acid hydroxylase superfamily)